MKGLLVAIFIIVSACGTTSDQIPKSYFEIDQYGFVSVDQEFKIKLLNFYPSNTLCHTEGGIPYSLIIGETIDSDLPPKLSVLIKCSSESYQKGKEYSILPIVDPIAKTNRSYIFLLKDSIIGGENKLWLLGSEFPAIWGQVEDME
ncbi:hypothetical protein [Gilvibacter sediminis]|uniref:hypothetical protein n=1 Tax=Gilvibacter sediminis TaxID=379071 RepID=UPI0023507C50|nr:hypothetical protein [Gilvibacter sediminis]MDC7999189.1 hypothetical protein [Gilvibacter sediminis]